MSGIGNTIETDLVGEHIELSQAQSTFVPSYPSYGQASARSSAEQRSESRPAGIAVIARGRCRAVTSGHDGSYLYLWLEVVDQVDRAAYGDDTQIGDVVRVSTDNGGTPIRVRLIKEP